jgi:hypothetical protein
LNLDDSDDDDDVFVFLKDLIANSTAVAMRQTWMWGLEGGCGRVLYKNMFVIPRES